MANALGVRNITGLTEAAARRPDCFFSHLLNSRPDHLNGEAADYATGYIQTVAFPQSGELRFRNVVSRSNSRSKGKYPSWKMDRMVHWESWNERNAFRLLDCDPDIKSFHEQPCKIVYVVDGVKRTHYPDILVIRAEDKEIWEVKPSVEALQPEVRTRTRFLSRALLSWGYTYRIALGEDLARQPRLDNASLLVRFGRKPVADHDYELFRRAIDKRGVLTWSEACLGDYGAKGRETLCSLTVRGVLRTDLDVPIKPSTQFFPRTGGL